MAWQLIYTSAPRLLEAGRTGFGTVARHRAINPLLAAAVERISQFARLPGFDARRVIFSHRCVTVAAGQFHVFSCIRDAGSDYTGRTNHIAHHLIAEAREVAAAKSAGITPADILLAMDWRRQWTEGPRHLEAAEEVPLAGLRAGSSSAWAALTGRADHARLPAAPGLQRGFYMVLPPGVDARQLFHESLAGLGAQAWQTTFTTSLQPNDDVADFRWIGVEAESPLRPHADNAARPVLDLTQPGTLPAPPPPPAPPSASGPALYGGPPPPAERLARSPAAAAPAPDLGLSSPPPALPAQSSALGEWSPEPAKERRRRSSLTLPLITAGLTLLVLIGVGAVIVAKQVRRKGATVAGSPAAVAPPSQEWRHFVLPRTEEWLAIHPAHRPEHEKILWEVKRALAGPETEAAAAIPIETTDEFSEFARAFQRWQRPHLSAGAQPDPAAMIRVIQEAKENYEALRPYLKPPAAFPPWPAQALKQAQAHLQTPAANETPPEDWRQLLQLLDPHTPPPDWLEAWQQSAALINGTREIARDELQKVDKLLAHTGIPDWLRRLADRRRQASATMVSAARPPSGLASSPPAATVAVDPVQPTVVVAERATHRICLAVGTAQTSLMSAIGQLPELEINDKMHLLVGPLEADQAALQKWEPREAYTFRPGRMATERMVFENGRLAHPRSFEEPLRIIAIDTASAATLFELIVMPANQWMDRRLVLRGGSPVRFRVVKSGTDSALDTAAGDFLDRLRFAGITPSLQLRNDLAQYRLEKHDLQWAVKAPPKRVVRAAPRKDSFNVSPEKKIESLQKQLNSLKKNAAKYEQDKKRIENDIAKAEEEKKQAQAIGPADPPEPAAEAVAPGRYVLCAIISGGPDGGLPLCEVDIAPPASLSPSQKP